MDSKNNIMLKWYSNASLKWIWMRSVLVAVVGCVVVMAIWGIDKASLLMIAVCVPLILGIFNSIFRDNSGSSDG